MRLAPEGRPFVVGLLVPAALAWIAALLVPGTAALLVAGALTLLGLFTAFFFRDPTRDGVVEPGMVLAPADGRVVEVAVLDADEAPHFLRGPCRRISVFLSIFDVHVQRAPVSGRVAHRDYRPGSYAVAWKPKASEENERSDVGLETPAGRVLVRQIAGLVARRIVTDPEVGERVERGRRIGLIRFGSRVDLFLPREWPVVCAPGERVRAGLTALGTVPADDPAPEPTARPDDSAPEPTEPADEPAPEPPTPGRSTEPGEPADADGPPGTS